MGKEQAHLNPSEWWLDRNNEILDGPSGMIKIGRIYAISKHHDGRANGKRMIECTKALQGIENPKEYIDGLKKEVERLTDILKYCWNKAYILNNTPAQHLSTCMVDLNKLVNAVDEFKPKNT